LTREKTSTAKHALLLRKGGAGILPKGELRAFRLINNWGKKKTPNGITEKKISNTRSTKKKEENRESLPF